MKLINMKMNPKEIGKDQPIEVSTGSKKPYYPWGLKLNLEKDTLKKLNLKTGEFKIGQKVTVEAIGEIDSLSQSKNSDYHSETISIQLTDIAITGSKPSKLGEYNKENEKGPGE